MDARGIPYTKSTFSSTKNCNLRINEGCFDEGETIAALGFVKVRSVPVPGDGNATLELGRLTKESIGPRYFCEESDDEKIWQQFFEPEIGQGGQSVDKVTVALFTDVPETIGLSLERMEQMLPKFGVTPPVHAMGRQGSTVVAPIETVQPEVIDTIRLKIQQQIGTEDRLKKIYYKLDTDHDGMLSPKEFQRLIAAVMKPAPTKVILKAIWLDACHLRKSGDGMKELDVDTLKLWIFQKGI